MSYWRRVFILLIFILSTTLLNAQENEARIDSLIDEIFEEKKDLYDLLDGNVNYHFIYLNTNFNNKTLFAGRELGDNLYNLSGQLYYFVSNGLFLGASGAWYSQMDPSYRMTTLSAGYSNGNNELRYRGSYARYVFSLTNFEPNYSNSLNVGATYKIRNIGARADYTFLFGNETDHQISFDLFSKIKLIDLGGYDKIRFEPEVSFYFGSETVETDSGTGDINNPFYVPTYVQNDVFGLMNVQIDLPISIAYKDFMFDVSYTYNFPISLDKLYSYSNTSLVTISLGYIFSL